MRRILILAIICIASFLVAQDNLVVHYAGEDGYIFHIFSDPEGYPAPDGWALYYVLDQAGDGIDGINNITHEPNDDDAYATNQYFYVDYLNGATYVGAPGAWFGSFALKIEDPVGSPAEPVINHGDSYYIVLFNFCDKTNATAYCTSELLTASHYHQGPSELPVSGWTDDNWTFLFPTGPPVPSFLTAELTDTSVELAWCEPDTSFAPSELDHYNIYKRYENGVPELIDSSLVEQASMPIPDPGNHTYWVTAVYDENVESAFSNGAVIYVAPPDYNCPTGLTASLSPSGVSLTWCEPEQPITDVEYYNVYRFYGGTYPNFIMQTDHTAAVVEVPQGAGEHEYKVTAVYAGGVESEMSEGASITIPPPTYPPPHTFSVNATADSLKMAWFAPDTVFNPDVDHYNVYWQFGVNEPAIIGQSADTLATLDQPPGAGDHSFWVTAVYADGFESAQTNTVTMYLGPPSHPAPHDLAASFLEESIELTWSEPDTTGIPYVAEFDHYNIYWRFEDNEFEVITSSTTPQASLEIPADAGDHHFRVRAAYADSVESEASNTVTVYVPPVGTNGDPHPAIVTALGRCTPNPFNPSTSIAYAVASTAHVHLAIYNLRGQLVKTLVNDTVETGEHSVIWNGDDNNGASAASGIYFYKMKSGRFTSSGKVILLK